MAKTRNKKKIPSKIKPPLLSDCRLNKRVTEIKTKICPKVSAAYESMDLPVGREKMRLLITLSK